MRTPIDMTAAEGPSATAEARALLSQLDDGEVDGRADGHGDAFGKGPGDGEVVSLGVLSGADLCVLGGTTHPVCWKALQDAWCLLDPKEQDQLAGVSTMGMLHRGLIRDQPPGRGVRALILPASYTMSAGLAVLLAARKSPALIIATHHESRTPSVTYFQPQGTTAVVEEIPERADNGARSPLDVIFSYRLLSQHRTAAELARWAIKPIPVARYQPRPPRLICFFPRTEFPLAEGGSPATSYQLAVDGDGERAHVHGPDISADLDDQELSRLLAGVVTRWSTGHPSNR
jgi:hypothetical protein